MSRRSTHPAVPWNWVIEALGCSEQAGSSTLIGLAKRAPALGKKAREMVFLTILENLFIQENKTAIHTVSCASAKIGFDASKHCEDVLKQILDETSELTESEKQKWDIHPFLLSKRSSLSKCPLKKLKEAILEGRCPLFASLKEKSNLMVENGSEDTSPVFDGNFADLTTVSEDDLVPSNAGNENCKVQENQLKEGNAERNCMLMRSYAREKENEISIEPLIGGRDEGMLMDHDELQEHSRVKNYLGETAEHSRRVESEMPIEPSVDGLDLNTLTDHNEHASSKKSGLDFQVANAVRDLEELLNNNVNVLQDAYREGRDKRVSANSMKKLELICEFKDPENSVQPDGGPRKAKASIEHDGQLETGTDSDRSDDERADIATKKEAFLSSRCIVSQDSMSMTDWTEVDRCIKCNGVGQVLVCSSDACLLRVHESCLGSAATLDENGKFFCPFCLYSRAISKYVEVKRKASLARKDLQTFFSKGVECRPKKSGKRQCGSREANGN